MTKFKICLASLLILISHPAFAALSFVAGTSNSGSASSLGTTLTANNSNNVLFEVIKLAGSTTTVTGVSDNGPGLTWTQLRRDVQGTQVQEVWYAKSASSFNATVTANLAASASIRVTTFAVDGADTTTPFDTNASFPGHNTTASATSLAPSAALSTNNANTLLFGSLAAATSATCPTGYTDSGISAGTQQKICYQIYSSTQSSISPTFTFSSSAAIGAWDAVQINPSSPTSNMLLDSAF